MQPDSKHQLPVILQQLPQSFVQFLQSRNIPLQTFSLTPPRYFRLHPQCKATIQQIAKDISMNAHNIKQLGDFYSIPAEQNIHQSKLYQQGMLYGMDVSSGYAVKALQLQDNMCVLELCCAPGNKLMYIRDLMKGGSVTGVDISVPRMEVTRSLVKKYGHSDSIQLYCQDAVKFDKLPTLSKQGYDRVLVDAECTHEGSVKHLKKFMSVHKQLQGKDKISKKARQQFEKNNSNPYTSQINEKNQWTQEDFEQRFLDPKKLKELQLLQMGLLCNGFRLLKNKGFLVYSTCSFDRSQNEQLVQQFLSEKKDARIIPAFTEQQKSTSPIRWEQSTLKGAVRFTPSTSQTGGLFIAKLQKCQ